MNEVNFLEQSGYKWAWRIEKIFPKILVGFILGILAIATALFFTVAVFLTNDSYLTLSVIFSGLFLLILIFWLFLNDLQKYKPLTLEEVKQALTNRAFGKNLTFFVAKILAKSKRADSLMLEIFFTTIAAEDSFLWILRRLNISKADFLKKVKENYQAEQGLPLLSVLEQAWQKALSSNHLHVRFPDLLMAVFDLDKKFQELMFAFEVHEEDLRIVAYWQRRREKHHEMAGKFWHKKNLLNIKGIGKDWSGGWTPNLDKVAYDLTAVARIRKTPIHLYGRRNQVDLLERILVRGSNAVLVGPPGVGRHTILQALASRINWGQSYGPLRYMRLLQIDSASILSGVGSLHDVVGKIEYLFGEALRAENVILVINNIDAFLDPQPEAGRVNATEALLAFFQSRLYVIGITTPGGYQTTIGKNPQLVRLLSKLEISEPTMNQTLLILQDEVEGIEKRSGLVFTHQALKEIVTLTGKLIQNLPNPEKSLEILEDTAVYAATVAHERVVTAVHVQKVVSARTKVPVEKVSGAEKETLLNLEELLHQRIIGQDKALAELANALRRARSGIRSESRPIGSFLFLGPTGVGKTETTKALAAIEFGSEKRIIRFDMSEFQELHSINRLIGDADAGSGGLLTEAVIESPFSLILLDEIEKAHPKILDIFLQVLDEGRLTDALGRTVSFVNTMIIATSNAGAEMIRQMVKEGRNPAEAREEILNELQSKGLFRPEFLNRFDAVIIFRPLSEAELVQVATLLLAELNQRLSEKDIQISITPELAQAVARGGYSPEFGARPLRRFIQERIENYIARGLISGEIKRGDTVEIPPEMLYNK